MNLPLWFWDVVPYAREIRWFFVEQERLRARQALVAPILGMELQSYTYAEVLWSVCEGVPWAIERDAIYVARFLHGRTGRGHQTLADAKAALIRGLE